MSTGAIILRPYVSGMTMVAVGRVRQRVYPMISVGHHRRIGRSGVRRTRSARAGCIAIGVWQRHGSDAGRGAALAAAAGDVLGVARRHFLTLVPSELYRLPKLGGYRSTVSTLPQQRVDGLYLVPTYEQTSNFLHSK